MSSTQFKSILKPARITVTFDHQLQKITGSFAEPAIVDEGQPFLVFLHCLLVSYPDIQKQYPPGDLGFTLNGHPPSVYAALKDGDRLDFVSGKVGSC